MKYDSSLTAKDTKYVVALVALMFMAGSLPTVQAAIQDAAANNDPVAYTGASLMSFFGFDRGSDRQGASSTEVGRHGMFSTSSMNVPPRPWGDQVASSTRPRPPQISPQDVVTLLFKNGIISSDKLDQARQLVAAVLLQGKQGDHHENGDHRESTSTTQNFPDMRPEGGRGPSGR